MRGSFSGLKLWVERKRWGLEIEWTEMRADEVGDVCISHGQRPLINSMTLVLRSPPTPTSAFPTSLSTPTRCCPPLPAQQAASGKPLIHMGEDLCLCRMQTPGTGV